MEPMDFTMESVETNNDFYLPTQYTPRERPPRYSGSQDFITEFNLASTYNAFVRPYLKAERAPQMEETYEGYVKELPGKTDFTPSTYLRDLIMAPPKAAGNISPFDVDTLKDAFSLRPGTVPGFDVSRLGSERDIRKRNIKPTVPKPESSVPVPSSTSVPSRDRVKEHDKSRERDKERDTERPRERPRERDGDRDRERDRDRDRDRERDRDKDKDRDRERAKRKDREKDRDKDKDKDGERKHKKKKKKHRHDHDHESHDGEHRKKKKKKRDKEESRQDIVVD
ncbi:hypothetical protein K7432_011778 [Basidiobolus ranarum]|uniref:Mediator of RNA polymerase II transcription subunit 19 n=1 Tax=Basidiobolus ranarum TaxID=34480 RepID=A0ABR2WLT2_9FUNG